MGRLRASATGRLARRGPGRYHGPMQDPLNILIYAALLIVLGILMFGIYALFRGGDFGRSYSNKLMRLRVVAQFIAIVVLMGVLWARGHGPH